MNLTRGTAIFGIASLSAIAAGSAAMSATGIPASSWARTVVAWAVGAALAALLARFGSRRVVSLGAVIIGMSALTATLFAEDVDGIHRWLDLGPLHINVAALALPALIVALSVVPGMVRVVATLIIATVLLAQPDASQLTAVVIAVSTLLVRSTTTLRWPAVLLATVFAIAGWTRPDALQPVPEVEQIFTMCLAVSPLLAMTAALALAAAALSPLASPDTQQTRNAAVALAVYFVMVSLAPLVGWFPVPLVGLGMSFPVGWWLGMGLLAAQARRVSEPQP